MAKLIDQQTVLLSLSRLLERATYYGVRALLVLYAIETVDVGQTTAMELYGWFTTIVYVSYLVGGLIGSLALRSRLALLIGGGMQTLGVLVLCVPNSAGLFAGGLLLALGTGIYSPNMLSAFAYHSRNKLKDLSSGFSLIYTAVNVGAFVGIYILGSVGESVGYIYGFLIGALLMAGSTILAYFSFEDDKPMERKPTYAIGASIPVTLFMVLGTILFWAAYEVGVSGMMDMVFSQPENDFGTISRATQNVNAIVVSALGLGFFFLWHFVRVSDFVKVGIGFLLAAIGMFYMAFAMQSATTDFYSLAVVYSMVFSAGEVLVTPTMLAIYSRTVNPKYVALILGGSFFLVAIGNKLFYGYQYYIGNAVGQVFLMKVFAYMLLVTGALFGLLRFLVKIKEDVPVVDENYVSDSDLLDS